MPRLSKLIEKIEDRLANKWGCWYERNKARVPLYAVLGGIALVLIILCLMLKKKK